LHENIACAVVRFYEAITLVRVKEFEFLAATWNAFLPIVFASSGRAAAMLASRLAGSNSRKGESDPEKVKQPRA
jgi:hypothetical protein